MDFPIPFEMGGPRGSGRSVVANIGTGIKRWNCRYVRNWSISFTMRTVSYQWYDQPLHILGNTIFLWYCSVALFGPPNPILLLLLPEQIAGNLLTKALERFFLMMFPHKLDSLLRKDIIVRLWKCKNRNVATSVSIQRWTPRWEIGLNRNAATSLSTWHN